LQTAEGALGETQSILQRMRELSVQAANDTLTTDDRFYIQLEISGLKEEINSIARETHFNTKRLLNGSTSAVWSASDDKLRANLTGSISSLDQFGQKVAHEGNYNFEITADPGQAQVLKSNLVTVKVPKNVIHEIYIDESLDIADEVAGEGWNFTDGVLNITGNGIYNVLSKDDEVTTNRIVVKSGADATVFLSGVNIDLSAETDAAKACAFYVEPGAKADIYLQDENTLISGARRAGLEVPAGAEMILSSKSGDGSTDGSLIVKGGGDSGVNGGAGIGGSGTGGANATGGIITINGGTIEASGANYGSGIGGGHSGNGSAGAAGGGGTITINGGHIIAKGGGVDGPGGGCGIGNGTHGGTRSDVTDITITGGYVEAYAGAAVTGNAGIGSACHSEGTVNITIKAGLIASGQVTARHGGSSSEDIGSGPVTANLTVNKNLDADIETPAARPTPALAKTWLEVPATLEDISQFYTSEGKFMFEQPQTITINQGDGKSTNVTLYRHEKIKDIAKKINDAIANGLGQAAYVDDSSKFCTVSDGTAGTSEAILNKEPRVTQNGKTFYATYANILVRTAVAGSAGELSFSGDEALINALGLNTIQEALDSQYNIKVTDAHTGSVIADDIKLTKNKISGGVIHENLEVEFDAMAGVNAVWNDNEKKFDLSSGIYNGTLHLAETGIVFQTGANQGDEVNINLGDMSSSALGVDGVNVLTRELAQHSITLIDSAFDKVVTQRAKIGAYIDSMGHTIENLADSISNLTAAESRIRDADIAKETLNFIKMQIAVQSGTSMLAQANQVPQSVLSLINR
ncbi:MAG: hypothetical protein IJ667_05340, partial [Synergistaceae bacterium]|nr:hypothetical protein [Synergistaceae bacterium]